MNDLPLNIKLRIFILQGIEKVGAGGKNPLKLHLLELVDIPLRIDLEEVFASHSSEIDPTTPLLTS